LFPRPIARRQRTVSIKKTLLRVFAFSVMIPIVLIDLVAYAVLGRVAYRGYEDDIRNVISSMDENLAIYFDQLENQVNQLSVSHDMVELMAQPPGAASFEAIAAYQRASERANQSLGARSDVASIRAYGLDRGLRYSRNMILGKDAREADERILDSLSGAGYGCQYYGVRRVGAAGRAQLRFFTLACKVFDLGRRAARGYLLVDLNYNMIDKFSSWNSIDGDFILAFDGKVAYSTSPREPAGSAFDDGLVGRMGARRFSFLYPSPSGRWQYLVAADRLSLMNAVAAMVGWIVGVSVLCFAASAFLARSVVDRVTSSLGRLELSMKEAEDRGFDRIEYPEDRFLETRRLVSRFNTMQAEILQLMGKQEELLERKARAEQQALQLQIAPHFLYNSLDSINCLAAMKGQTEISEMIVSLSEIFRYTAAGGDRGVTLGRELDYLRHYCSLQAVRYQDSFKVEYEVPEPFLDLPVVKFMLQPLVENAITHGVGGVERDGLIRVGAEAAGDRVCVYVWNNGAGFDGAVLAEYRGRFAQSEVSPASVQGGRKIGLLNIFFRLRLRFGPAAGIEIETGEGTKVKVLIPRERPCTES